MIEGVGRLEAHVLFALDMGMPAEKFGRIHHLPAAQLAAVIDGMRDRGLIGDDGWLSEEGRAVKERVEALTDDLAAKPTKASSRTSSTSSWPRSSRSPRCYSPPRTGRRARAQYERGAHSEFSGRASRYQSRAAARSVPHSNRRRGGRDERCDPLDGDEDNRVDASRLDVPLLGEPVDGGIVEQRGPRAGGSGCSSAVTKPASGDTERPSGGPARPAGVAGLITEVDALGLATPGCIQRAIHLSRTVRGISPSDVEKAADAPSRCRSSRPSCTGQNLKRVRASGLGAQHHRGRAGVGAIHVPWRWPERRCVERGR